MAEKQQKTLTPSQKVEALQEEVDSLNQQIKMNNLRQQWRKNISFAYDNEITVKAWDIWGSGEKEQAMIADMKFFNISDEALGQILHAFEDIPNEGICGSIKLEMTVKTLYGDC
jgi:hypothetical protein